MQKQPNQSRCRLGADLCGSKELCVAGGPDPQVKRALLRGTCAGHCLNAAAGECDCPAPVADEYICCRAGDQTAMKPFAKLLWTLVYIYIIETQTDFSFSSL